MGWCHIDNQREQQNSVHFTSLYALWILLPCRCRLLACLAQLLLHQSAPPPSPSSCPTQSCSHRERSVVGGRLCPARSPSTLLDRAYSTCT
jgi:hypothetical protein